MTFFAALLMLLLQVPRTGNDTTGATSGRVADESGRPIAGVPVVIRQPGYGSDGEKVLHHAGRGITNDRGEYRIFGLKPGTYYALAASAEQTFEEYLRESGTPVAWDEIRGSGYVPTYYPGGTDPASARTLDVGPGWLCASSSQLPLSCRPRLYEARTVFPGAFQANGPAGNLE